MQYSRNNWQLWTWSIHFIFLTDMCSLCWQKREPRPKLFLRLDISSTFRRVHTLIFTYVPYVVIGLHEETAPQTYTHQQKGNCLPNDFRPSYLQPTQLFFRFPSRRMHKFSYHTTVQKLKKIYSKSLESSHTLNSTVPIFSKSKKSIQT